LNIVNFIWAMTSCTLQDSAPSHDTKVMTFAWCDGALSCKEHEVIAEIKLTIFRQ